MGEIYEKVHKGVQRSYEVCEILNKKKKKKYDIEKKKKKKGQFGTTDADWMFFSPGAAERVLE